MNGPKYFYGPMVRSYWIDCEILEKRKYDLNIDASKFDLVFMEKFGVTPEQLNADGYYIKYFDSIVGECITRWVTKEYVKI